MIANVLDSKADDGLGSAYDVLVSDPAQVHALLKMPSLSQTLLDEKYRQLEQATGLSFSGLIEFFRHFPAMTEGENHKKVRVLFAKYLVSKEAEIDKLVVARLNKLLLPQLYAGNSFDLFEQVLRPITQEIVATICDVQEEYPGQIRILGSQLINPTLSIRRRLALEQEMLSLLEQAEGHELPRAMVIGMCGLIFSTLPASMSINLQAELLKHPNTTLDQLPWAGRIFHGPLNYVDRIVTEPTELPNLKLEKGTKLRLVVDKHEQFGCPISKLSQPESDVVFGAGKHRCLGERLTRQLVQRVTDCLSTSPLVMSPPRIELQENHRVSVLKSAIVSLSHPSKAS